jgi:hypothetical protein
LTKIATWLERIWFDFVHIQQNELSVGQRFAVGWIGAYDVGSPNFCFVTGRTVNPEVGGV